MNNKQLCFAYVLSGVLSSVSVLVFMLSVSSSSSIGKYLRYGSIASFLLGTTAHGMTATAIIFRAITSKEIMENAKETVCAPFAKETAITDTISMFDVYPYWMIAIGDNGEIAFAQGSSTIEQAESFRKQLIMFAESAGVRSCYITKSQHLNEDSKRKIAEMYIAAPAACHYRSL